MDEQQLRTIKLRVSVKTQIALEGLLNVIAKEAMFADVQSEEIVQQIKEVMIDNELFKDMVAYLDDGRSKVK